MSDLIAQKEIQILIHSGFLLKNKTLLYIFKLFCLDTDFVRKGMYLLSQFVTYIHSLLQAIYHFTKGCSRYPFTQNFIPMLLTVKSPHSKFRVQNKTSFWINSKVPSTPMLLQLPNLII